MKRPNPPEFDQPSRAAKRNRILPRKIGLRLFTRDVKFALPLAPSKAERMIPGPAVDEATEAALGQCVDVALKLLEEGRGNTVLVNIGKQIVAERREAARAGTAPEVGIYSGDIEDMPIWVARFLGQVRQSGIPICVCDSLVGYGLTQRWAWGGDMEDYDCRTSAVVYIHQGLVESLLKSKSNIEQCTTQLQNLTAEIQDGTKRIDNSTRATFQRLRRAQANAQMSFERAVFCISAILAHEFVHCFTGFLTGGAEPGTPPGLNASPYSDREHGEAGWNWSRRTFGGLGHVWFGKDEPAEPEQFGVPTLLEYNKRSGGSFFYQLDHAVIRKVIGMDWVAVNKSDPNWILKLKVQSTKTPYKAWNSAYEEVVVRSNGRPNLFRSQKMGSKEGSFIQK
ncbi:hypothetical protein J7T55_009924 [Diaporthe amygdali]|uniref:uncharacterized protein n=1 Tax=Phomopsis amygdali TaxID=1214568 RepID=UPI0022FE2926|nr:uncharacterized protein J7T55_009924 [Diaporthe amygdali]KAJ0116773.1 hypothetical protein J7T55_009924 [Diaporthe amygdali]